MPSVGVTLAFCLATSAQARVGVSNSGPHGDGSPVGRRHVELCMGGKILPSIFLLGAQKAGSTSLFSSLHKDLQGAVAATPLPGDPSYYSKELHIFDDAERSRHSLELFSEYFPRCSGAQESPMVGLDGTPNYLMDTSAPARAHQAYAERAALSPRQLAGLTFVVVLRDPVDRFLSWVGHKNRLPSKEHVFSGDTGVGVQRAFKTCMPPRADHDDEMCRRFGYALLNGIYRAGIERWVAAFPSSAFVVTSLQQYVKNTSAVVAAVAHASGLSCHRCEQTTAGPNKMVVHANGAKEQPAPGGGGSSTADEDLRAAKELLTNFYAEHNAGLWVDISRMRTAKGLRFEWAPAGGLEPGF